VPAPALGGAQLRHSSFCGIEATLTALRDTDTN